MPAVLYGNAYNEIFLVSMVFANMEEGLATLKDILGEPCDVVDGVAHYEIHYQKHDEEAGETCFYFVTRELYEACKKVKTEKAVEKILEKMGEAAFKKVPASALFTSYDGGCGDCTSLQLKSLPSGKPFIPWNLD